MIIFITLRILDIITTLLNIQKYGGWEVELNPLMRIVGGQGIIPFLIYQIVVATIAILIINRFKYKNIVYGGLSFVSLMAIVINIYCLTL